MKRTSADTVEMKSFEALFEGGDSEIVNKIMGNPKEKDQEQIIKVTLDDMYEFENHPFKVKTDKRMAELVESVAEHGVLVPGIIRKRPIKGKGTYEIVAGHCRKEACRLNQITEMPMVLKELSDAEAKIIMVDSNIQREDISIKEKAFAYKIKFEALKELKAEQRKKKADQKKNEEVSQFGTQGRSDEIMAKEMGECRNQIQRYIRLTYLIEPLLDLVDQGKITLMAGYELSFIKVQDQQMILECIEEIGKIPSQAQAEELKKCSKSKELNKSFIRLVLQYEKEKKTVVFKRNTLKKYFPDSYSFEEIETVMIQLLEKWKEEHG